MRIIGIDPGYERLGFAVLDVDARGKITVAHLSCVQTEKKLALQDRLANIGHAVKKLFEQWAPDAVALERLYFSTNVKTALTVAEVRGIIRYEITNANAPLFEYGPADIKIAVTGHGRSDKRQVEAMVRRLVKVPQKDIFDDEFDALAIALTCIARDGKSVSHSLSTTPARLQKK